MVVVATERGSVRVCALRLGGGRRGAACTWEEEEGGGRGGDVCSLLATINTNAVFPHQPSCSEGSHPRHGTCADSATFSDIQGYSCSGWAQYDCDAFPGIGASDMAEIREKCPEACGGCYAADDLAEVRDNCVRQLPSFFDHFPRISQAMVSSE